MAVNTSRAWTGSTIAPQVTPAVAPAIGASNIPAAVTGNVLPQGNFYNSLLNSLFGAGGGNQAQAPAAPQMDISQGNAINWLIQQIGAENWNRDREMDIRRFYSPAPAGAGMTTGLAPQIGLMGGGPLPIYNPVAEQFLSAQRLAPSVALGQAAASFGSGGAAPAPARTSSGWVASPWGY